MTWGRTNLRAQAHTRPPIEGEEDVWVGGKVLVIALIEETVGIVLVRCWLLSTGVLQIGCPYHRVPISLFGGA
jgi:hypothetical protein